MRRSCITSKFVFCSSGDVNVLQWNTEWFFSRRAKFDSGFNVMVENEVSWHGPEIIYRFTGIRKWVVWLWKRSLWFSKKVNITLSLNWSMPYQGGCSQFLISSRCFDSSICDGKNFPCLGNITSFALSLFEQISDASIVSNSSTSAISTSPFQIHPAYRAYPRNNPGKTFFPNWWILDWSFAVIGWYSNNEPNGIIGPLNGCPKRLSWGVFPSDNRSVTFRR